MAGEFGAEALDELRVVCFGEEALLGGGGDFLYGLVDFVHELVDCADALGDLLIRKGVLMCRLARQHINKIIYQTLRPTHITSRRLHPAYWLRLPINPQPQNI